MVDPITLATVTSALTLLSTECAKGMASQAGKDIWARAKGLLGLVGEPATEELPKAIATKLHSNEALLAQIITVLKETKATDSSVKMIGSLVGTLSANKVIVAQKIDGGITM
jgi:hypothetical protein